MPGYPEIKTAIDSQHAALDAFVKRYGDDFSALQGRVEEIESGASLPGSTKSRDDAASREHKRLFENWLRSPHDSSTKNSLGDFESKIESKDVTIASNPGGGFAVPTELVREIERLELLFSPVRRLVKTIRVSTGDAKILVNTRGTTSAWASESTDRSTATDTPQLREVAPTFGEIYAYPQASEWSLDDIFFNLSDWLAEESAQAFSIAESAAVISGDGSSKPTGMTNSAPTAVLDFASPPRAAAVYEFVPSLSTSSPAVAEIEPDSLIDLAYRTNSIYRANATWVMNSATMASVRKLKDTTGQYLWQPSMIDGQPDRLLGYPVETWEALDDIGTNALPIAFGDFRRGYVLADRTQLRITIDSNVTTPGRVKFFIRRRVGGMPLNNNAIKFLKTTIA